MPNSAFNLPELYRCGLPDHLPDIVRAPLALTIGNFDGVHLGHQAVLNALKHKATALSLTSAVMTFEPYPKAFFQPNQAPARLTSLSEKILQFSQLNLDAVYCFKFNNALASMPAELFIEAILVNYLNIKVLIVGHDFHFGYKRQGNFALLEMAAQKYGFELFSIEPYLLNGERVSSTKIRSLLSQGKMFEASQLLGHSFFIMGHVGYGDQRGRKWGFPTANIILSNRKVPIQGIFAVKLLNLDSKENYLGVASIGIRPMYYEPKGILEVHLLNFKGNLYGKKVKVIFLKKIRDEMKFSDEIQLVKQIENDVTQAQNYFSTIVP